MILYNTTFKDYVRCFESLPPPCKSCRCPSEQLGTLYLFSDGPDKAEWVCEKCERMLRIMPQSWSTGVIQYLLAGVTKGDHPEERGNK